MPGAATAVHSAVNTARAELPDVLVGATAEQNFRGLWSKYRPTRHRRESHDFPDRQESEDEARFDDDSDRQMPSQRERARRRRRRSSVRLPEAAEEPSLLVDLIPRSRTAKAGSMAQAAGYRPQHRREHDVQQTVLTPLFPRRHLRQPCTLCGQIPGDDTQQLAYEHLKLQGARDRLAAEEARVQAQEHQLALKQQLLLRDKEVEVLMAHAQVSAMELKELVRRHQHKLAAKGDEQTIVALVEHDEVDLVAMAEEEDLYAELENEDDREAAAARIQAAHRGKVARQQHRAMSVAATRIQAAHRGRASRAEIAEEEAAVVRIQAIQRGNLKRSELAEQRDAALRIQAAHRGKTIRQDVAEQHKAAIQIQACYRGTHVRQEATTAVALQRAQELEQARTEEAAAVKIQSTQRGRIVRAELLKQVAKRQHAAATKIQAWQRGKLARRRIPALERDRRRREVLKAGHVGMRIEKRNYGQAWEEGYITSVEPLMVTHDCSIGPLYSTDVPGSEGTSWDDVRLLSLERGAEVEELAALAIQERRRQEVAAAAARAKSEAEALQQAISVAEAQVMLAQADQELAVGTCIAFHTTSASSVNSGEPLHGQYVRFKKNRTGANEHYIDFGGGLGNVSIKALRLKKSVIRWRVVPMSDYSRAQETVVEGKEALATLVAELKPDVELA
eukprot:COSAG02_NODE_1144_length_14244_cov_16.832096_4_plen_676_part_00